MRGRKTSDLISQLTLIVGILALVIGAIIPIVIYLKGRSRKLISYKVPTQEPLLSVSEELRDKLQIFYESKPVENVTLFKIEIINSGTEEISEQDYIEPITIFFGKKSQILSKEITEIKPSPFKISATLNKTTLNEDVITLSKTMLNSGDSIKLKVFVTKSEFCNVSGRIAGGNIELDIPTTQTPNFWWKISVASMVSALAGTIISALFNQPILGGYFALIIILVGASVFLYVGALITVFISTRIKHKRK